MTISNVDGFQADDKQNLSESLNKLVKSYHSISETISKQASNYIVSSNGFNVLIDEKIILDVFFQRKSFYLEDSILIYEMIVEKRINGYLTDKGLIEIGYLSHKLIGEKGAIYILNQLLNSFMICKVDLDVALAEKAYESDFIDLNDKMKIIGSSGKDIDAIISQTPVEYLKKFSDSIQNQEYKVPKILKPSEFLDWFDLAEEEQISLDEYYRTSLGKTVEILENELRLENENTYLEPKLTVCNSEIEDFYIYSSYNQFSRATVIFQDKKLGYKTTENAYGTGPIDALCRALDRHITSFIFTPSVASEVNNHSLYSIKWETLKQGLDAPVSATVILKYKNSFYLGEKIHKDTVKAAFYAYGQAVNNICLNQPILPKALLKIVGFTAQQLDGIKDLSQIDLSGETFTKVNWQNFNLSQADLNNALIIDSNLSGVDLRRANLKNTILSHTNLTEADLSNADLTEAKLENVVFDKANLFHANMTKASLSGAKLRGAKLNKVELSFANLSNADLSSKANLDNANLAKANFSMANLSQANLHEATLSEAILNRANLTGADLSEAILNRADLSEANLTGANLTGADLSEANLTGANLTGADLSEANLTGANLTGANLSKIDLSQTKLDNANLCQADLSQANLKGVDLSKSILCRTFLNGATMPNGYVHKGLHSIGFEMREVPFIYPRNNSKDCDALLSSHYYI